MISKNEKRSANNGDSNPGSLGSHTRALDHCIIHCLKRILPVIETLPGAGVRNVNFVFRGEDNFVKS